jgi:hypothetical protein
MCRGLSGSERESERARSDGRGPHYRFHPRAASRRAIALATFRSRETNRRTWPAGPWWGSGRGDSA